MLTSLKFKIAIALSSFFIFNAAQAQSGKSTVTVQVQTLCISSKSTKPPDQNSKYNLGKYPSKTDLARFEAMHERARELESKGKFNDVPIHPQRRVGTLTQLAIWKDQGEKSSKKEDSVTRESIGDDFLAAAQTQKSSLNEEQRKNFDENIRKIFEAADLTQKVGLVDASKDKDKPSATDEVSPCSSLDNTICGEIFDKVEKGQLSVELAGDGVSTTHVELRLTNETDRPMLITIPEGQVFVPDSSDYQYMMVREGSTASLPPSTR